MLQESWGEKGFKRLLEGLAEDVVDAHIHWRMHRSLVEELRKDLRVSAQTPTFWHLTLRAHEFTAVQNLCRAYDQQSGALSLQVMLEGVRRNLDQFSNDSFAQRMAGNVHLDSLLLHRNPPNSSVLEEDIAACRASDPDVKSLVIFRNNILAHRNSRATVEQSQGRFGMPVEVFERLLERAITVLNRYTNSFEAVVHSTAIIGRDDFKGIFSSMQHWLEMHESMDREWLKSMYSDQQPSDGP